MEDVHELKEKIRVLEDTLNQNDAMYNIAFNLPGKLGKILGLLMATTYVDADTIEARLGIATPAKVALLRLRRKLEPFGIEIKTQYALGYWIAPEHKEKIKAHMAGYGATYAAPETASKLPYDAEDPA